MFDPIPRCSLFAALLVCAPCAQEPALKPDLGPKQALLRKALQKMSGMPSFAFSTRVQTLRTTANNQAAFSNPAAAVAEGGWAEGRLWASANDGLDQVVWNGRRMIARHDKEPWSLRQGAVGAGLAVPKVLDPDTFFLVLEKAKLELIHAEVGALEDRPVEILTLHAAGEGAIDLLWAGLFPDSTLNQNLGVRAAMPGAVQPIPVRSEIDIDIAIFLDPATARIHQIHVRGYSKGMANSAAGGLAMGAAVPLPGAPPKAVEKVPEKNVVPADAKAAAQTELVFEQGLPIRKPKDKEMQTTVAFDIKFTNHEAAKPPELDAQARELLNLR